MCNDTIISRGCVMPTDVTLKKVRLSVSNAVLSGGLGRARQAFRDQVWMWRSSERQGHMSTRTPGRAGRHLRAPSKPYTTPEGGPVPSL
jgi:hypothetical protein